MELESDDCERTFAHTTTSWTPCSRSVGLAAASVTSLVSWPSMTSIPSQYSTTSIFHPATNEKASVATPLVHSALLLRAAAPDSAYCASAPKATTTAKAYCGDDASTRARDGRAFVVRLFRASFTTGCITCYRAPLRRVVTGIPCSSRLTSSQSSFARGILKPQRPNHAACL